MIFVLLSETHVQIPQSFVTALVYSKTLEPGLLLTAVVQLFHLVLLSTDNNSPLWHFNSTGGGEKDRSLSAFCSCQRLTDLSWLAGWVSSSKMPVTVAS